MTEIITSINSNMLVWAREVSGTSINEAEEKFGKEKLNGWEKGTLYPSYTELKNIGKYYRKPIAVFFFPEPPAIKNIPASCRTLPFEPLTIFNRNITKMVDWARALQINLYELNDDKNRATPKLADIDFDMSSISATAKQLREILKVDVSKQKMFESKSLAFEQWRDCFFKLGIYVFKNAFKDNTISGFCIYETEFPVICINNSLAPSRQIFTLFHEIYHLISQTSGVDLLKDGIPSTQKPQTDINIELACNQFAGTFLVPDKDFLRETIGKEISDENIQNWSDLYSVSREVILRKLFDANRITDAFFYEKRDEYIQDYYRIVQLDENGNKKGGGNYYYTQATYKGARYLELAYGRYYEKRITLPQLARYLDMKVHSVRELASQKGWGAV